MMPQPTVSEFFDSYARDFDAIYGTKNTPLNRLINRCLRSSMQVRFDKTIAGCDPIEARSVIDIGCGPGHYAVTLASMGASTVLGIDFAEGMIDLAKQHARKAGVIERCEFVLGDFLAHPVDDRFDYSIVMGFMDYMPDPGKLIDKVLSITRGKAFFSFPAAGGLLAWQRKLRYRKRCTLCLYTVEQLNELFANRSTDAISIERIDRDFFVTVTMNGRSS